MHLRARLLTTQRLSRRGAARPLGERVCKALGAGLLLCALVLSLVLSPLLSRLHQLVHPGHGHPAAVAQTGSLSVNALPDGLAERSFWERLFSPHADGSPVCQLLDHSGSSDGPGLHPQAQLLELPTAPVLGPLRTGCAAGALAFFQARGPPTFF